MFEGIDIYVYKKVHLVTYSKRIYMKSLQTYNDISSEILIYSASCVVYLSNVYISWSVGVIKRVIVVIIQHTLYSTMTNDNHRHRQWPPYNCIEAGPTARLKRVLIHVKYNIYCC